MNTYKFNINWNTEIEVESDSEETAWNSVQDMILDAYGKGKGDLTIDLASDFDEDNDIDVWGAFDTDPEETHISSLAVDDSDYL